MWASFRSSLGVYTVFPFPFAYLWRAWARNTSTRPSSSKAILSRILEVKRSSKDNVPLDERLRLLHLGHEFSVSDDTCRVAHFVAGLVKTGDDSNDGALCDIGKFCDLLERLRD